MSFTMYLTSRLTSFYLGALLLAGPCWLSAETTEATVAVAPVVRRELSKEVSVQAEFRPYQEIELHAKVAGYLQEIKVDIGDQVKAGDLLGTLEVPELREDFARGTAALQRAQASYKDTHLNYTRLASVAKSQPNLVSQQDLDAAEAKDAMSAAAVTEARSELDKYSTLEAYTRITAPFSGVITKRFADAGALIQAGTSSSTQAMPLVRLSQNDRLRLSFPVSVLYADKIAVGDPITLVFDGGAKPVTAAISRLSGRISTETRTMLVESDITNADLKLIPGMYVTVELKVERRPQALAIPAEAVAGTKERTVYVVNRDHVIEERPVKLGLETATSYEVLSGVGEGELVVVGSRTQLRIGQKVSPKTIAPVADL